MNTPDAKSYSGYTDIVLHQIQGKDYEIHVSPRPESKVAIIAPHGGAIERGTSDVARAIAAEDFCLYLFEGIRPSRNYESLHLTSHLFDEPQCLELIAEKPTVVAIHGCNGAGPTVFLGGLNIDLKEQLANAFYASNISVQTEGHPYPATNPVNICNRGLTKQGVQIELTDQLRGTALQAKLTHVIREVLLGLN